jgi:High potential iron-sulfur protein
MNTNHTRRRFILQGLGLLAIAPMIAPVIAQSLKPLSEDSPPGKAVNYSRNASQSKHASYKSGSSCGNCQFFNSSNSACGLMSGYGSVGEAWCSAWAKKA